MADTESTATAATSSGYGGAKTATKAAAAPAPYGGATIYLGPNIRKDDLLMRYGMVFKGGELPEPIASAMAADPSLAALVVPVADMARAKALLSQDGTTLNRAADAVSGTYRG